MSTPTPFSPSGSAGFSASLSAQTALDHFREALRAKQARVRQGPNYPAPNPYSGRSTVPVDGTSTDGDGEGDERDT